MSLLVLIGLSRTLLPLSSGSTQPEDGFLCGEVGGKEGMLMK